MMFSTTNQICKKEIVLVYRGIRVTFLFFVQIFSVIVLVINNT